MKNKSFNKLMNKWIFSFFIVLYLFFVGISTTEAEAVSGTINANQINFRSGPGTGNSSFGYLYQNTIVSVINTFKVPGLGCDSGWYNIYYNSKNGYVCSSYVTIAGSASYSRPWNSPKKSILGGAEFISNGYINKGQNTSYLKKFNVNPNSYYGLYNHQYMANLSAPTSESSTSYISYRDNGLLSLPLIFTIPLFNNMPDLTTHPTAEAQTKGQDNVTDQNFENQLNAEGFPETYKRKLRLLHNSHPNWVFKSLKTNQDFGYAVSREKQVSSINGCSQCYEQPLDSTEPGWYIANNQTVEYYLDPRNFLREERILMFEDLSFKEEYNASVVASILGVTFMNGLSILDNQTYASIFVDAGRAANVSPVYLASLARQESGVKQSNTTSGARFSYKGQTYEGFFNFFNIGAFSSEQNPALAGLVYASAGSLKNSDGVYVGGIPSNGGNEPENPSIPENPFQVSEVVNKMGLRISGSYLISLNPGVTVATLRSKVNNDDMTLKRANGAILADWEKIGTGTEVHYKNGTVHTIILYGDLTGDGEINSADLLQLRLYLLREVDLSGAYLESAKTSHNSTINSADLLQLRLHLLGSSFIRQI